MRMSKELVLQILRFRSTWSNLRIEAMHRRSRLFFQPLTPRSAIWSSKIVSRICRLNSSKLYLMGELTGDCLSSQHRWWVWVKVSKCLRSLLCLEWCLLNLWWCQVSSLNLVSKLDRCQWFSLVVTCSHLWCNKQRLLSSKRNDFRVN